MISMKKISSLFIFVSLVAVIAVAGGFIYRSVVNKSIPVVENNIETTKYGAFLAAQHAMYVNDFARAADFMSVLDDVDYPVVNNTRLVSDFLMGKLPDGAKDLKDDKTLSSQLIYDAYLVKNAKWNDMYKRHRSDASALSAPLRIWSSAAINHRTEAIKFINSLNTNDSWKSFARGQVYAAANMKDKAAEEFAKVRPDFMNINDYLYVMSFYRHHDMPGAAARLRQDFTSLAGGVFMDTYENIPDWSEFSGFDNQLAFSLVQNVSHTQIMMYSDLAILLLSFAEVAGPNFGAENAALNYYKGQYFFTNSGDFQGYFNRIPSDSPYYLFAGLRIAERSGDITHIHQVLDKNPLFTPALTRIIAYYVQQGNRRAALRAINRALDDERLSDLAHAHFLKIRAQINYVFGDYDAAQSDLHAAADVLVVDVGIISLQAKIWAAENREIENAYDYAMVLVKKNPTDINAWDTLGAVIAVREGPDAALELLSRVASVANTCSSLFELVGDLYMQIGNKKLASEAYLRAIDLSDDGLTTLPNLQKKLRKAK